MRRGWALALLALYLVTQNRQYQFDALDYATHARTGESLFHPHHLLYNAFGWLLLRALPFVEPLRLLAAVNAVVTTLSLLLLARLIANWTGSQRLARGLAIGYGLLHGIWYMATAVEVYPIAIAAELAALALLASRPGALDRVGAARVVAAGVASGVAMLFHQTALFSVPAFACLLLARRRAGAAAGYVAVAGAVVGGVYAAVAVHEHRTTLLELTQWLTAYAHSAQFHSGAWGGGLSPARAVGGVLGATGALMAPSFVKNVQPFVHFRPGVAELAPLIFLVAALALFVRLLVRVRGRPREVTAETRQLRRALGLWALTHALFTLWWESVNFEFWLMLLAPLVLRLAFDLRALDFDSPSLRRQALALLICLGVGNFFATFLPDARPGRNGWRTVVTTLERAGVRDGDLLLSNEPMVDAYNRYFGTRRLRVASLRETGGAPDAIARLGAEVDAAAAHGGAWLLETETLDEYPGVPRATVAAFWTARLAGAEIVGSYVAWGRSWRIYRLSPPPAARRDPS